ncbi:beta-lactamase class A [Conyzicola nivalis]|uniref:Beta-lactamase n=1 Tax=Conyzicola nivalis TaxID=1477021 RepID=A0ABV2QQW3_9MICO
MTPARTVAAASALTLLVALTGCTAAAPDLAPPATEPTQAPSPAPTVAPYAGEFEALETEFDARLGVYAIDTATGAEVSFRADERFAYASTFKALAAAAVLQKNTAAGMQRVVTFTSDDLITYSPVTELRIDSGMTLIEIADAAVRFSDNTAGNLLLDELGGPGGFDAALAAIGDDTTRAERWEAGLNDAVPGDPRDTTSPRAFATDLREFALGDAMSADKQAVLIEMLKANTTGANLIRAGVPADWVVGDKTGSGGYGVRNDIAIVWPPGREPIVMAIMSTRDSPGAERYDALIARAATAVVTALG